MPEKADGWSDEETLAFFHFVRAVYKRAESNAGGCQERNFVIAGRPVRLHFAGEGLIHVLTPALEHLAIPPGSSPELTVLLWDSASTGTALPAVLSRYFDVLGEYWLHLGPRGEIKELTGPRIRAAYHLGPNIFSMIDLQENLALYWVKDAQALPYYELGSPLRTILHWWTDRGGSQFVHAGAIGRPDGGVLLAGKGGSGKSTAALACVDAGFQYASDDYCVVQTDPQPFVFSVYNTAKLRGQLDLARFPNLAPLVSNRDREDGDKAVLFLQQHFPEQVSRGFPLRAILLPVITGAEKASIKPAGPASVLAALAPSTLFQLPGAGTAAIKSMSKLVHSVPGYTLELGSAVAQIPILIAGLLEQV